ncbi:T9SS type A sorting domain-containing protein [Lacinutrix sp. C3R15]|uniref:T9SS type A sorting domain-containing protein n=1 Tax=Flavobacteriaceae TaxID=49546 RepID=UPI001C093201|nr:MULTISPECIES: T9SS type A sorting domain-containing protein [Flavobacteriaceae]MBU2940929.1 T9SS type A sorting domain-containing protein [Lacinutrix sp. C3R15]MDO6624248.1 T9SS type A sorting domain-containing protein [Oceanihabitans sp. 1_MG-2023]
MKTFLHCYFVAVLFTISTYANYNKSGNNITTAFAPPEEELTNFTYEIYNGPSTTKTFSIDDGLLLTRPYTVIAPSGYEVSTSASTNFADQIVISGALISLGPVTVYVRLKANLIIGTYSGNITVTAPETTVAIFTYPAINYTVSVTGEVTRKETIWSNGAWTNGTPTLETTAILNDNYHTDTYGNLEAWSLNIAATKTVTVANNSYLRVEKDVTVNGTLDVESKGSFVQVDDLGTFTVNTGGTSRVNKETSILNKWYDYTYWSSPVNGATANTALASAHPSMRYWFNAQNYLDELTEMNNTGTYVSGHDDIDDNGDDWAALAGSSVLQPGVGYAATHSNAGFVAGNSYTYTFTGPFNTGTITTPIYYNGDNGDLDWNFIGNPYPSAINVEEFFAQNDGIVGKAVYLWSHATPPSQNASGNQTLNFSADDYVIINGSGGVAGASREIPSNYIPSGQGFFIQGLTNANATFTNVMRVADATSNEQFFRDANAAQANKIWLNLTNEEGVFNQALIAYVDGATDSDDGDYYDAVKNLSAGCAAVIYSTIAEQNNKKYAIQSKNPQNLNPNQSIALGFKTTISNNTQYTIGIARKEGAFFNNNTIFLKDNLLNTTHDLSASNYTFNATSGEFNSRFEILFTSETLSTNTNVLQDQLSIIQLNNAEIICKVDQGNTINSVEVYNTLGQLTNTTTTKAAATVTINSSALAVGTYLVKVLVNNKTLITKKLVKRS